MYDLVIIGGGRAGAAAAIYAARKRLKTIFLTSEWGGQSAVSSEIQNWVGTPKIMGADLADNLKKHVEEYKGEFLQIVSPSEASGMKTFDDHIEVVTKKGDTYSAAAALVATGANRRKLEVPGAAEYDQKGLTYCASCDGPLFADHDVAVIGGGNAAFETAAQLLSYAKSVTLLIRGDSFKADEVTVEKVLSHQNMKAVKNAVPKAVKGSQFLESLVYEENGAEKELPVTGIFVEIGLIPTTWFVKDLLPLNKIGQIPVDPKTQRTTVPGVWAAGDSTDGLYHQNNIAAGDAVKALEDIYLSLHAQ